MAMHLQPGNVNGAVDSIPFDFAHLAKNKFKCPQCGSIVYSRKSRFCGVCGHTLPESFLFSPQESARVQSALRSERARHRKWLLKRDDIGWNLLPVQ